MLYIIEINQKNGAIDHSDKPGKMSTIDEPRSEVPQKETEKREIEKKYHFTIIHAAGICQYCSYARYQ